SFTIIPVLSSILTALVGSGFSTERFSFRGFLPVKIGRRERELRAAAESGETIIFFDSPYRLTKTLAACIDVMPDRQLCVARELTKKFEEFRRGTARELFAHYEAHTPKGEIALAVKPCCSNQRARFQKRCDPRLLLSKIPHARAVFPCCPFLWCFPPVAPCLLVKLATERVHPTGRLSRTNWPRAAIMM